ncbi:MAG: T9SS type A sorting domain-containing protein, partial [Candidatus Eisenbacteria bacterium]|nr:T9SS type A sorting domain-containing protein [Candidatus Eisenbacteria bacterium]
SPSTALNFQLAQTEHVTAYVYDMRGRRVRTLADGSHPAGRHSIPWNGRDDGGQAVANGVYFMRFQAGETSDTIKLTRID